ncbi:hypothetical protein [Rubrivirga sp. IMCC45206]|uniref:hypothetical protein n=1 Tax=Rubrivirga sp. IMCC45206 TaxID=3391614 RepID=UPI00398FB2C1
MSLTTDRMRLLALALLVAAAGCATDPDAAGTSNPGVTTPAEAPVEAAAPDSPPVPADSATSLDR